MGLYKFKIFKKNTKWPFSSC